MSVSHRCNRPLTDAGKYVGCIVMNFISENGTGRQRSGGLGYFRVTVSNAAVRKRRSIHQSNFLVIFHILV